MEFCRDWYWYGYYYSKKDSQKISRDISDYFEINPDKILGETREKTNRFGRKENYVHGNLEGALLKIEQLRGKKEVERIGNLLKIYFWKLKNLKLS